MKMREPKALMRFYERLEARERAWEPGADGFVDLAEFVAANFDGSEGEAADPAAYRALRSSTPSPKRVADIVCPVSIDGQECGRFLGVIFETSHGHVVIACSHDRRRQQRMVLLGVEKTCPVHFDCPDHSIALHASGKHLHLVDDAVDVRESDTTLLRVRPRVVDFA